MTLPRLESMSEYWAAHPPTHILVAAYLGVGKKEEKGDLNELAQMLGGGLPKK